MIRSAFSSISPVVFASSSRRTFHRTPIAAKTVSETAHDVNIKVGKGLASVIEKGERAADATKHAVGGSSVKDVAENVERSVRQGLASALGTGKRATEGTKQTLANTKETANVAGQKADRAAAGLKNV
ncbi:hypothetical protein BDY19DRAFT_98591 [Irpex rosettiformis]|uniref:Uncharacterized protein n=1 Tax=Irpex rosettiformis TaxID=378272 RepID=A0ACB8U733_9APHY|nr:hypothetical protein BDY19DRAFT_98591 [Irpex rosettiformis]